MRTRDIVRVAVIRPIVSGVGCRHRILRVWLTLSGEWIVPIWIHGRPAIQTRVLVARIENRDRA